MAGRAVRSKASPWDYYQQLFRGQEFGAILRIDKHNTSYILHIMKTTTSVKLDKNVKEEAAKLASLMGLNLSSVINGTLKRFLEEKRIVFSAPPEFNLKTKKDLIRIKNDIKKRKNIVGPFDNVGDLKKSLLG